MFLLVILPVCVVLALGCGLASSSLSSDVSTAPEVPAGTALRGGVGTDIAVTGDLAACGLAAAPPTALELTAGPKNGPFDTFTLRQDPAAWQGWDGRPAMDLMSLPAGAKMTELAAKELGRAPAPVNAYGVAGGYEAAGEACDVHLYAVLVEPTVDGWQLTEVARRATLPPTPFDDNDPSSKKVCGLDRAALADVAPCGTRVTTVRGVKAPEAGGALTGKSLLAAAGLARGMASWSETEALLVGRLGAPTRVENDHYTWAVRDGATCVWFDVQKGWPAPVLGDGKLDPKELVGTVTEPYAAVDGAPYYAECLALTGG